MSWQEDLRKLDEELAMGRLSADDYRARRDQVLSSAVVHEDVKPAPERTEIPENQARTENGSPEAETLIIAPVSPPQGIPQSQPPASPPQRPLSSSSMPSSPMPSADSTQIVRRSDDAEDRTQVVSPRQVRQDADRTQVVSRLNSPTPTPPPGFSPNPPRAATPWHAPQNDVSPPWSGAEFPPIATAGSKDWLRQGPDIFESHSSENSKGKLAIRALIALVVIGGLIAGGIWIFSDADEAPINAATPPPAPACATGFSIASPNASLLDRLPKPPGQETTGSGVIELSQLTSLQLMDQPAADALSANGVTQIAWRGSTKCADENSPYPDKFAITAMSFPDQAKASSALLALSDHFDQLQYVNDKNPLGSTPTAINLHKEVGPTKTGYYGMWVSNSVLIQVHVWQDPIQEEAAMSSSYQRQVLVTLANFLLTPPPATP